MAAITVAGIVGRGRSLRTSRARVATSPARVTAAASPAAGVVARGNARGSAAALTAMDVAARWTGPAGNAGSP